MSDRPPAPPGWYPQADSLRYWDGTAWTEHIAPLPHQSGPDVLVIVGYILVVVFPIAAVIVAGFVLSRHDPSRRHGYWIIGLSVFVIGLGVAAALSAS